MWMLITLLWRITRRLMRRLGKGALLVPVAAIGMAVLGVTVWTVAALALAAVLAIRRPSAAAGLLPAALICAGLWGLALAATTPGAVAWTAMPSWSIQYLARPPIPLQVQVGKAAAYRAAWRPVPQGATVDWTVLPPSGLVHLRAVGKAGGPGYAVSGQAGGPGYAVYGKPGAPGYAVYGKPGAPDYAVYGQAGGLGRKLA